MVYFKTQKQHSSTLAGELVLVTPSASQGPLSWSSVPSLGGNTAQGRSGHVLSHGERNFVSQSVFLGLLCLKVCSRGLSV